MGDVGIGSLPAAGHLPPGGADILPDVSTRGNTAYRPYDTGSLKS